jgi:hypothetical protein
MAEEMERLKPEVETPLTGLDNHLGHKIRVLTRTGMTRIGFPKEVHSHRISVGRSRGKQGQSYEISLHDECRNRVPNYLLLQWVRADFYSPISQFLVKATAPMQAEQTRYLPPGRETPIGCVSRAAQGWAAKTFATGVETPDNGPEAAAATIAARIGEPGLRGKNRLTLGLLFQDTNEPRILPGISSCHPSQGLTWARSSSPCSKSCGLGGRSMPSACTATSANAAA